MSSNCDTDTNQIKQIIDQWFQEKYGNVSNYENIINQINHQCVNMSSDGINLLLPTNLVDLRTFNNIQERIPYNVGFHQDYTGKHLILAILGDRNMASNHHFLMDTHYNQIMSLLNMIN